MAQATMFDRHYGGGKSGSFGLLVFAVILIAGLGYAGSQLVSDLAVERTTSALPYILLGIALLIALGFEFVNGFHDTANAVATVIYTHSLQPNFAVMWSGAWNFLGVLTSSGAVAFGIISLLPVELILQVGSSAGFAMVFALLIAAIIWNLGTWYFGLPSSSSHTLIGSIIGVGLMNQLMASSATGTSGVDWSQASGIGRALLFSPLVGFVLSAALLLLAKAMIRIPGALQSARGADAAAAVDPRPVDHDLHRRQLRARLQRRSEGHGSHHADPDRHRADHLCAQPRGAGAADAGIRRDLDRGRRRAAALYAGRQRGPPRAIRARRSPTTSSSASSPPTRSRRCAS